MSLQARIWALDMSLEASSCTSRLEFEQKAGIWTLTLMIVLGGWGVSLETGIWAVKLECELWKTNLGFKGGRRRKRRRKRWLCWTGVNLKSEKNDENLFFLCAYVAVSATHFKKNLVRISVCWVCPWLFLFWPSILWLCMSGFITMQKKNVNDE